MVINMKTIKIFNNISDEGLNLLDTEKYSVSKDAEEYDAALVRSAALHDVEFPSSLVAIARAGAGVNNIPLDVCTKKGICVFNTPGANANAVKELVIAALLMSSRRINESINWVHTLTDDAEISKTIEKNKAAFVGPEIMGKTIGVIGLGAIGAMVANAASALGMNVIGYDPYITVKNAWMLSRKVLYCKTLEELLPQCDYITIHVPVLPATKGLFNEKMFNICKKGVRLLNFSRGELVVNDALFAAIENGTVERYATDFPTADMIGNEKILTIPHLGASTPESEDNCARMAVNEVVKYMETGNVTNSVNFPNCELNYTGLQRITIFHANTPNMVGQFTQTLAKYNINIAGMANQSRGEYAYTIIDIDNDIHDDVEGMFNAVDGVVKVRII